MNLSDYLLLVILSSFVLSSEFLFFRFPLHESEESVFLFSGMKPIDDFLKTLRFSIFYSYWLRISIKGTLFLVGAFITSVYELFTSDVLKGSNTKLEIYLFP